MPDQGSITFQLTTGNGTIPVVNAVISIYDNQNNLIKNLSTDSNGKTTPFAVDAPNWVGTYEPFPQQLPYAEYNALIEAEGYIPINVNGIQVYDGINSIEELEMNPQIKGRGLMTEIYDIPEPAVISNLEPLIASAIPNENITSRILNTVYIPSTITVHLGSPNNTAAENVTVSFPDYIKNVASSEIYPTWPENALRANIYAQISFALNRIFTEWYPSRGYNFNITNHTGYDQFFVKGRNIFENISNIVDEIFNEYVRRMEALNPLFTEYCNGTTVTCNGLSQWGTVYLAEQGFAPLDILQYYYGPNIEITSTDNIQNIISSYPGYALREGMRDPAVQVIKVELNRIRQNYPLIPSISNENNYYDQETTNAVKVFQQIFNLTPDGIVGKATWNKLSYLYVSILKLAELNGGMVTPSIPSGPPTVILKIGSRSNSVKLAQYFLAIISQYYDILPFNQITGYYGEQTRNAVIDFQKNFELTPDGIIGPKTWEALYDTYLGIANTSGIAVNYPGVLLKEGSRGDQVWLMQSYLQKISEYLPIPNIQADGIFGPNTKNAVIAFQEMFDLTPDGIIGPNTWDYIVAVRLLYK